MNENQMQKNIEDIITTAIQDALFAVPKDHRSTQDVLDIITKLEDLELPKRLIRVARQFGIPAKGNEGLRAHFVGTQTPCDKGKPIVAKLEFENTRDMKIALAKLDMAAVNVYGSQLEFEGVDDDEDTDDGQEELDLDGEEAPDVPQEPLNYDDEEETADEMEMAAAGAEA